MASHRSLVSNVGVGLLALSVLVLGAQANTAVMLDSENQALATAPGNDGKNEEKKSNPGNSSPGTPGNGSSATPGNGFPGNGYHYIEADDNSTLYQGHL